MKIWDSVYLYYKINKKCLESPLTLARVNPTSKKLTRGRDVNKALELPKNVFDEISLEILHDVSS